MCKKINIIRQKLFLPIISDIDNVCNKAIPADIEKTIEIVAGVAKKYRAVGRSENTGGSSILEGIF